MVVAENTEGEIVGFADCGKREGNTVPDSGDLTSIYILKDYQGKGLGSGLLKHIFLHVKSLGCKKLFVELIYDWDNLDMVLTKLTF